MTARMVTFGAALMTAAALLGSPVATAQPADDGRTWEMPDMAGMKLAEAEATFTDATAGSGLKLEYFNAAGNYVVYNQTNWLVCNQSPKAGTTLKATSWVGIGINRPYPGCS